MAIIFPTSPPTKNTHTDWTRKIRIGSIIITVFCLIAITRFLPLGQIVTVLETAIQNMGFWGPILFALLYVISTVMMLPGAALTLAIGGIFGLTWGTAIVSVGSTVGAAFSFLISRYAARRVIERKLKRFHQFQAVDTAIRDGGWKIVVLLRLSPAVPFNLQNYLYGLTAIKFWPCVMASWLAMLPGTFMYVYLGHAGLASVSKATRTPVQWAMLVLGLAATIAVTVYITRLARNAMQKQTTKIQPKTEPSIEQSLHMPNHTSKPLMTAVYLFVAIGALIATGCAYMNQGALKGLFGPPPVVMSESYHKQTNGQTFNHHAFDQLLKQYVNDKGGVDYQGLQTQRKALQDYIAQIGTAAFNTMGRDEKLALLINSYNAFTLELILDHWDQGQLKSIKDIASAKRWNQVRWEVAGMTLSLSQIEHQQIRPHFIEPRIHFALVCAAVGCPPLRNEAYTGNLLQKQLTQQAEYVHAHARWYRLADDQKTIGLTQLYNWYGSDFKQFSGSILNFAAQFDPKLKHKIKSGNTPIIQWLDYDWTLNSQKNID